MTRPLRTILAGALALAALPAAAQDFTYAYSTDLRTLTDHARIGGYQLIGLSGGSRRAQDAIVKSVRILRDVAPSAAIAIGGEVTKLCPNMLNESGADLICGDVARDALAFRKAVLSRTGAPTGRK